MEEKAIVDMTAGQRVKVTVEYTNSLPEDGGPRSNMQPALMRGLVSYLRRSSTSTIDL